MGLNATGSEFSNTTQPSPSSADLYMRLPWYAAYMAALFEADRTRAVERIERGVQLILQRERELFSDTVNPEERRALNRALEALRALYTCVRP